MTIYIKFISEDTEAISAIKQLSADFNYIYSDDNCFVPEDINRQSTLLIADKSSIYYPEIIDKFKERDNHRLIILTEKTDSEISHIIRIIKVSGVIFKPIDSHYFNAAIEKGSSVLHRKNEAFSIASIIQALDEMPLLILLADINGKVKYTNTSFHKITGYDNSEIEFHTSGENTILENISSIIRTAIHSSEKWSGEIIDYSKKGDEFILQSSIVPVKNNLGIINGYIYISENISAKKEIDFNLEKSRILYEETSEAKTRFISTLSHEIRTPMNAIIGMTDLALLTNESDEVLNYLIDLKTAAGKLLTLTDVMLDFSKAQSGEMKIEMNTFNLYDLVKSAINRFIQPAEEKDLSLSFSVSTGLNKFYYGDSLKIAQILDHLISNSIKFSEKGCINIEVTLLKINFVRRDTYYLTQFSVTDKGIGISADKHSLIFEKFQQVEDSKTRRWGGTGLGLSLSKSLVELMDGSIGVESTHGSGSRFYFNIPLKVEEKSVDVIKYKNSETYKSYDKILNILLVEDNPINARLAETVLKKLKNTISIAKNGMIALEMLAENNFDLIFMDIEMPVMDGIETTKHIRAGDAGRDKENIPIVAMTAYTALDFEQECLSIGMNYFLTKPINIMLIPELLNKIVSEISNSN